MSWVTPLLLLGVVCLCQVLFFLLGESELTRTFPHLHPRSVEPSWPGIPVPGGVGNKGMERDDRGLFVQNPSWIPFCNICSTVAVISQLKRLGRFFVKAASLPLGGFLVIPQLSLEDHPQSHPLLGWRVQQVTQVEVAPRCTVVKGTH